jgi:hypothetical protein
MNPEDLPVDLPKFTQEQLKWLEAAFPASFRIKSVADLEDGPWVLNQLVFHQGGQLVIDRIRDLVKK